MILALRNRHARSRATKSSRENSRYEIVTRDLALRNRHARTQVWGRGWGRDSGSILDLVMILALRNRHARSRVTKSSREISRYDFVARDLNAVTARVKVLVQKSIAALFSKVVENLILSFEAY